MMKKELEALIEGALQDSDFEIVNIVYLDYPGIGDKEQIAELFKQFGMVIFNDLYPRAAAINALKVEQQAIAVKINQLNTGKIRA